MMCNRCWAMLRVASSVRNEASSQCDSKYPSTTRPPVRHTLIINPVRRIGPMRSMRPAPIACAPRIDAVIAIDNAGNCT
ncbi:hypothetical protein D3C87_1999280 [compost metagenome]